MGHSKGVKSPKIFIHGSKSLMRVELSARETRIEDSQDAVAIMK